MTIDELRARKRLLLEQKREAEEAGDKWEAAFVNEELLDVNAQLRALTHGHRKTARDTRSASASDRQQYENWARREDAEETGQARAALREKAAASLEGLTPRQRETLTLYAGGMKVEAIAEHLGVDQSTVSRTLARARRNAARTVTQAAEGEKLLAGSDRVDLGREDALRAVVQALTPKQLVYFYLYYSEGLSLREIGALIGTNHATICRTIKRALLRLDKLFPGGAILEHPEAVDEAAYWAWRELDAHPELVQEPVRALVHSKPHSPEYRRDYYRKTCLAKPNVAVRRAKGPPGKLLALLRERAAQGTAGLLGWLEGVFQRLKRRWKETNTKG